MPAFDRDIFFMDLQQRTGLAPKPAAKDGLNLLLDDFDGDAGFTQIRDLAYVLATIRWETGQTFQPVKEKRASRDKNPRLWEIQNHYWSSGFLAAGTSRLRGRTITKKRESVSRGQLSCLPPAS